MFHTLVEAHHALNAWLSAPNRGGCCGWTFGVPSTKGSMVYSYTIISGVDKTMHAPIPWMQ
jgi:hypothetical protein